MTTQLEKRTCSGQHISRTGKISRDA